MSPYRNYLLSDQVIIPVTINNPDEISDDDVLRAYSAIVIRAFRAKRNSYILGNEVEKLNSSG